MKNINVYPIMSSLHNDKAIKEARENLLGELSKLTNFNFKVVVDVKELYSSDLGIILVESGGSENYFLKAYNSLKEPFIFLTFNHNNSLAASLEILSFLNRNNKDGEILHGEPAYIASRIKSYLGE